MELDSRIIKGKRPLTYFEAEQGYEFIGKECYFSDYACKYEDLDTIENTDDRTLYIKDFLKLVDTDCQDRMFKSRELGVNYRYCLPVEWTEEKQLEFKWRAYTISEFQETFTVGRAVRFRRKDTPNREHLLIFNGYYTLYNGQVSILFGIHFYTLEELFEQYEWQEFYTDEYRPFGIKETI